MDTKQSQSCNNSNFGMSLKIRGATILPNKDDMCTGTKFEVDTRNMKSYGADTIRSTEAQTKGG